MDIEASLIITLDKTASFHESDRFYQYLRHVLNPRDAANIYRVDELEYQVSFSNRNDMRLYAYALMKDQRTQRLEFEDISHLDFQIDMLVNDLDETFMFYNDNSIAECLDIIAKSLDEQTHRLDDLIKFINDQKLGTYESFRNLILETLVNNNMLTKTVTQLDKSKLH